LRLSGDLQNDPEAFKTAIIERCRLDVLLFATIFFPHYCRHAFNPFHKDSFEYWRTPRRKTRVALAAPRGTAKSTIRTLIKPVHDICYGYEKYICIFSNTHDQAIGKTKDIKNELLDNTVLKWAFGNFFSRARVPDGSFVATTDHSQTMVQAFGSGAEVRGIRFGAFRPSKIICDDVEHSEEVFNEEIRAKYESWYREVITNLGDEDTSIEFVGTLLHKKSLLAGLLKNPAYTSTTYQSIISWSEREDLWDKWRTIYVDLSNDNRLDDASNFYVANKDEMLKGTEVFWPEKETYLDLMKLQVEIGPKAFAKERQNQPMSSDDALFKRFHFFREEKTGLRIESSGELVAWKDLRPYAAMDPSTGQSAAREGRKSDYTCILVGYVDEKGRVFVQSDWTRRSAPSEWIEAVFDHCERIQFEKFGIETNLYRNLLLPNLEVERKKREKVRKDKGMRNWGIRTPFYDIESVENKIKRIHTLEPKATNGWLLFSRSLSQEFMEQMEQFPLGEHDDCPDTAHMLYELVHGRYSSGMVNKNPMAGR